MNFIFALFTLAPVLSSLAFMSLVFIAGPLTNQIRKENAVKCRQLAEKVDKMLADGV